MSLTSKQLEQEIAAMEGRLASVKVTVEIERDAWKRVAKKGKKGTKWKGAATANTANAASSASVHTSRSEIENLDGEIVVEPMHWDSLELAQYLQSKQLAPYAQIVVYEQITGKLLLDTAPSKLRILFDDLVAGKSDPAWKNFLSVCSQLHKLQKSMRAGRGTTSDNNEEDEPPLKGQKNRASPPKPNSSATVFPLISPRVPPLTGLSLSSKATKSSAAPLTTSLHVGGEPPRLKTPGPRKGGTAASHNQQMVTCWNCSARFPRAVPTIIPSRSGITTGHQPAATRVFCSEICQRAIESSDMRVSASLSLAVAHEVPKPPPPHAPSPLVATVKSPRRRPPGSTGMNDSFDFLHIAHRGSTSQLETESTRPAAVATKQASGRKRVAPSMAQHSSGGLSPVASITAVRSLPDDVIPPTFLLHGANSTRVQSRTFQQSRYKLDPEMFHANGVKWTSCFDATVPLSPTQKASSSHDHRATNLESVVSFLTMKAVYHLSLVSRKWFELIHVHPSTADRVWGLLLRRMWVLDLADEECLRGLGFLSTKAKKPRRVMMKLTRQIHKIALEGMKTLLNTDNWQLAPTCRNDVDYLPLPQRISGLDVPQAETNSSPSEPIDRGNDLYEVITIICNRSCEIVAIQAQELIRPIDENGSTMEILNGIKDGILWRVDCRRLRLFSSANRLPFSEWYLLPDVLVVLEFCEPASYPSLSQLSIWHLKVLSRLQRQLEKRLLSKESVQQVMRWIQDRSVPQQALAALEQFLVRLAPPLVAAAGPSSKTRH